MRLSFVWWNTSLSPAGNDRATDKQRHVVCEMVDFILNRMQIDFLALGEMAERDAKAILKTCDLTGFDAEMDFPKVGRSRFDTCFLYRREKLVLLATHPIISKKGNRSLKIAQRADFMIQGYGRPLHVFVSHWPSLSWCHENSADRHLLGVRLRDAIEELSPEREKLANVILVGDYNDEPFDVSLAGQLMATRDRELASKKPHLLYNPFWRHLCCPTLSSSDNTDEGSGGTYFHKSGEITRWRTFDQIIFSSAFLGHGNWHLNEELTGILDFEGYGAMIMDAKEIFDHFPVFGVIDEVNKDG